MALLKFYCVFLFISVVSFSVVVSVENTYVNAESKKIIKNDIPLLLDLNVYLPVLNRTVDFCEQNKDILSMNLIHGLFFVNVNLEPFAKDLKIPEPLRVELENILTRSERLQKEFHSSTNGTKIEKLVAALAFNATSWSKRVQKLNFKLLAKTYAYGEYPQWSTYLSAINTTEKGTPSPRQSDLCIGAMLEYQENISKDSDWRCVLPEECYESIINGTDFGYWLTHRIMLLLHARLSRNCGIFSSHEDELYRLQLCERAYREAEYIALNGFQLVDLLMEQIAICSLDGHAQFLRRTWLTNILDYQQPCGCFQFYKLKPFDEPDKQNCNDYAMAVAASVYAAAIRLVLEKMTGSGLFIE